MAKIVIDPESTSLSQCFATIKTPRKNRERYSESSVTVYTEESLAIKAADPAKNLYPAIVYGPSVSSESQRIYYLVRWL